MRYSLLLILVLFEITCSFAKDVRFDHFDTRDGISQNNINSLVVDSIGYVWIGTLEGLTRFDGSEFKIFRPFQGDSNAIRGNYVDQLSSSPNGNLWIHTRNGGMNLYNASQERFEFLPDSCFKKSDLTIVTSMVSASDTCFLFTDATGLYKYSLQKKQTISLETPFEGGSILSSGQGQFLYWGSGGLYDLMIHREDSIEYKRLFNSPVKVISEVFSDSLVIICSDEIHIFNLQSNVSIPLKSSNTLDDAINNSDILAVAAYQDEIWFGLSDGLLYVRYDDGVRELSKYSYDPYNNYSFHGKDARSLCFDRAGNLWIGTSKYGLNLYNREKNLFEHHRISALSKSDQEIDPVRAICKTADGSTWVGFDRLGLVRTMPDGNQVLYERIYLPSNKNIPIEHVRSIYEDANQNLWLGTNFGICIYNPVMNRIESSSLVFGWEWKGACYFLNSFEPGELIVTSLEGLATVDLDNMSLQKIVDDTGHPVQLNGRPVRSMVRDSDGNYWISFDSAGLVKLTRDSKPIIYTSENSDLIDNKVYSLCILGDTLWIATNKGLMSFDTRKDKAIKCYYEADGLVNDLVYSIIFEAPYLWLSTNRGISRMDLRNKRFENFLTDDLFMDDAFFKSNDGEIYFGGYDGYISFYPNRIVRNQVFPKPLLSQLFYNNRLVLVGENIKGETILPVSIQKKSMLQLNYGVNSFSLGFDAFPFYYPDHTLFRYRLKGLSQDWILAAKNENRAVFTNLSPDDYWFEVQASFNGIDWSEPATLSIHIIPPFWMQSWFRILALAILTILGVFLIQLRIHTIKRRNRQLQERIREQTRSIEDHKNKIIAQKEEMVELSNRLREADQAKLKFYTNVSHEFRTPLTIIMGNLDTLKEQVRNQTVLKNIGRSTERLFRLVNQFIDLRRYDQGELKVAVSEFDIVRFTSEIIDSFQELAARKKISLRLENTLGPVLLWLDKDKTDKILYNLLSNAIKYTGEGGSVLVGFSRLDKGLELIISDTGYGIPEEELRNVFKGYYRGKKTAPSTDGHGLGLALVSALVEAQHASITCDSKPDEGTVFRLLFQWGNLHFNEEDILKSENIDFYHQTVGIPEPIPEISNSLGQKVLLVEDNVELLEYLTSLFGKRYQVFTAVNGKDAIDKLKNVNPEIVITDLMMPVMDGIELCKELKKNPETRFVPVIILSAKTDVSSKMKGIQLDVDDYIEKPFHPGLLLAKVSSILKKRNDIRKNLENFLVHKDNSRELSEDNRLFIEKVMLVLSRNYADSSFSVELLSSELFMSRVTFYRKMKEITGEGPGEFIRRYRLREAAIMLSERTKTVGEVCTEVGFQSLSHFRKSFRDEFGVNPSRYPGSV